MPEDDDLSLVRKSNVELQAKVDALTAALTNLTTAASEPPHVSADDISSNRIRVRPEDIASGAVLVDFPESEPKEPRTLKDNEIRKSDQRRINAHINELRDGTMVLVD